MTRYAICLFVGMILGSTLVSADARVWKRAPSRGVYAGIYRAVTLRASNGNQKTFQDKKGFQVWLEP